MDRIIPIQPAPADVTSVSATAIAPSADGLGCHAGKDAMQQAALSAGKGEILAQYAADYPRKADAVPSTKGVLGGSL